MYSVGIKNLTKNENFKGNFSVHKNNHPIKYRKIYIWDGIPKEYEND